MSGPLDDIRVLELAQGLSGPYADMLLGDAGARVIKDTTKQTLPPGFQTAEFLLKHGLIDQIVSRLEMRNRLHEILSALHLRKIPTGPAVAAGV